MNFNYKKLLPYVLAIVIFYVIVVTYFSPAFNGYELPQGDVAHWEGMSKEIVDHRYSEGNDPKWTNSMFSGMPAYQITNIDNSNKVKWIHEVFGIGMDRGFANLLVAFCGFYILMVLIGINPWLSIVGGIAFGLSTYNIIILSAGHNTKLAAIGWMPAVFGAVIFIFKNDKKEMLGLFLLALFMALELYSNHVQITYYLGGLIGIFMLQRFIESVIKKQIAPFFRKTSIVVVAVLIGVMCNFGSLYNTYNYAKHTIRGKSELKKDGITETEKTDGGAVRNGLEFDYITQWSLGIEETVSIFIANVKGGASGAMISDIENFQKNKKLKNAIIKNYQSGDRSKMVNSYWGNQPFTSGPVYMGVTVFILFVVGMVLDKGYFRWTVFSAFLIYILLAWGRNFEGFNAWVIENIPMYNKFRAVSMTMVIVQLLLPFVGFWGVNLLIKQKESVKIKLLIGSISSVLTLLLLFLIKPEMWFTFFSRSELAMINLPNPDMKYVSLMDMVKEYRIDLFKEEVQRALLYTVLVGGSVVAFVKYKFDSKLLIGVLGVLVLSDLWTQDQDYLSNEKDNETKEYKHWRKIKKNENKHQATTADLLIADMEFSLQPDFKQKYVEGENKLKDFKKSEGLRTGLKDFEKEELKFKVLRENTHYRVLQLGNPFNNSSVSYFHKSIGGYHAAKLMRYQELIENCITSEIGRIQSSFASQDLSVIQNNIKNAQVLNMLNMKYLIYNPQGRPIDNPFANGYAWPIKEVLFVENPNEEIENVGKINTKTQAVIDVRYKKLVGDLNDFGKDTAIINLKSVKSNELKYQFQSASNQIMIFSDVYYEDGWNAYIDGDKVPHFRANYVLRGLKVPLGKHEIAFKFEPSSVSVGMTINTIFSILVLLGVTFFLFKEFKSSNNSELVDGA